MTIVPTPALLPATVRDAFAPTVTYLNAASYGLLPKAALAAVEVAERGRVSGEFEIPDIDRTVLDCRAAFGRIAGMAAHQVAIGSQVSPFVGLVAESLPPGARVLLADHEFTSVSWPFLARKDLVVRIVPIAELAASVRPDDDVVAVALVQSADGYVVDAQAVVAAAHANGARVLLDVSQAAGWIPLHDTGADWIVSVGFKWLLGPKGTAFLAGTDAALDTLRPLAPGWYAGDKPWETVYDAPVRLAADARRFDVSPVWPAWLGQLPALELLLSVGIENIHRHNVALADRLRTELGLPEGNSAIVSLEVTADTLERLRAARVVGAVRAGRLRLGCHLYNTEADIDRALNVLTGH
ncbi:aminotransferase class V-fold PLP-dependent enzyme [Nocardia sp. SYP-A9097]|uniref:aminotransferase class V-fold PLP-dependent enzyme n=1 Tax=Nocardia sp. SYP-A9097 TaxID=2663237 RepID=UPI00129AEAE6|nr:aminotransferase class V-fold PLP-dependent enzyme [Nocardia sp. SYP-A9097]MRH90808.1 aminotransferase class V-fold PLP-dependent enzyme [Nocardia sp. SYP-A9097]